MKKSSLLVIALIALAVIGIYNMMTGSQPETVPAASTESAPVVEQPAGTAPASAPMDAAPAPATESAPAEGGAMAPASPEAAAPAPMDAAPAPAESAPAAPAAAETPAAPTQQ